MNKISTDVLVVGAGSAGIAAAAAASRMGKDVVVIDPSLRVGGNATSAEVGTVCGIFHNNFGDSEYAVGGFAKIFCRELADLSGTEPVSKKEGIHFLPYHIEAFEKLANNYVNSDHIQLLLGYALKEVEQRDGSIQSCLIHGEKEVLIMPKAVVDCSGNSIVAKLANHPLISESTYQSAAQVFRMKGIAEDREDRLSLNILKAMRQSEDRFGFDEELKIYIVPGSLKNGSASFKIALPFRVNNASENDLKIQQTSRELAVKIAALFIKNIGSFSQASLDHVADKTGFRVAARTRGKSVLTGDQVRSCDKSFEGIAVGTWPMEVWSEDGKVSMSFLPEYGYYEIPASCLIASELENLFMGGRIISADSDAIASARVMGTCLQTGYAAGYLASAVINKIPLEHAVSAIRASELPYL